jgi:hypothetical protein
MGEGWQQSKAPTCPCCCSCCCCLQPNCVLSQQHLHITVHVVFDLLVQPQCFCCLLMCCAPQASGILPRLHPRQIRFAVSLESAAYYSWIDDPQYMCK